MCKILFVYPNKEAYPIIPISIGLLSGILKREGHEVELFDITFMMPLRIDHVAREKSGVVEPVNVETYWGPAEAWNIDEEFKKKIESFDPNLIAFSIVENNYGCARNLFKTAKETKNVPILVGGLFPTMAPKFFIEDRNVDLICVGEGEHTIVEIAKRIDSQSDFSNIPNLIAKSASRTSRGPGTQYYQWNPPVFQDWEIFDQRHLFKPFMGRMRRAGYFELARGCPYNCSFCNNLAMQKLFRDIGKYNRERPIRSLIDEICLMKERYQLDLVFFNDENFLQMNEGRLGEFCREYKAVGLPFFIATRANTLLKQERVKILKDAGCVTVGIGIECGNESFRNKILNKNVSDQVIERAFSNCRDAGIRTTAYIMIGLPFETEENIVETAKFCRRVRANSVAVSVFAPYYGTELRRICVQGGFMEDRYYEDISVNSRSILSMPQISRQRIEELYYQLHDLIFGDEAGQ